MNQILSRQISILFYFTALHCTNRTSHAHWRFLFCLLITEKLRCQLDRRPLNLHQFCLTKRFQIVIRPRKKNDAKSVIWRNWECCSFTVQYQLSIKQSRVPFACSVNRAAKELHGAPSELEHNYCRLHFIYILKKSWNLQEHLRENT